jgi:hypothetical protein
MSEPAPPETHPPIPLPAGDERLPPRYDERSQAPGLTLELGLPPHGEYQLLPGSTVRYRNPIVVGVLTVITLGIHTIVWWYLVNRELADHGRALGRDDLGTDPAASTLAYFPGGLVVVPAVWTSVTTFQRIQAAQRLYHRLPIDGWLGLVLGVFLTPVLIGYMQSGLNSAWSAAALRRA